MHSPLNAFAAYQLVEDGGKHSDGDVEQRHYDLVSACVLAGLYSARIRSSGDVACEDNLVAW